MKITKVSEQYGISSDTLRYYERIGLIPPVCRNENVVRDYSDLNLKRVEFIRCMRSAGLRVETLIDYIDLVQQGDQTVEARKEILEEQRDELETRVQEMQKTLELLNCKIARYEDTLLIREQEI